MTVEFEVRGLPAAQGSKSAVIVGGRAVVIEGRRKSGRDIHRNWRSAVAEMAHDIATRHDIAAPFDGPLCVQITYRFPMPASRPKADRVRGVCWKTTAPDIDKLDRATFDGLTAGGLIVDDKLICDGARRKLEVAGWTGAVVTITPIAYAVAATVAPMQSALAL